MKTVMRFSGKVTRAELDKYLADERENARKRKACPQHRFGSASEQRLADTVVCELCGASLKTAEAVSYLEGCRAAGGNAQVVWSGWRQESTES